MTDRFRLAPPQPLLRLELWNASEAVSARFAKAFGATLPGPNRAVTTHGLRVIWREPSVWMIRIEAGDHRAVAAQLADVAGTAGAVTDISGAAARCAIQGAEWRVLLTYGGVFDAEDPAFAPGCVAGTMIEHMAVRFDVISETLVDAYVAPSYAADLLGYWASVARDLDVRA